MKVSIGLEGSLINKTGFPYQSFAGADGSSSPHLRGFHGAKEVAGIPLRVAMLRPVGAAVPPLQDVVTWDQVVVCSQIEH